MVLTNEGIWILTILAIGIGFSIWAQYRKTNTPHKASRVLSMPDAETSFEIGMEANRQGSTTEALAAFRRADAMGHDGATYNLAVLLERIGNIPEAKITYERSIAHGYAPAAASLALLFLKQGMYDEASLTMQKTTDGSTVDRDGLLAALSAEYEMAIKNRT